MPKLSLGVQHNGAMKIKAEPEDFIVDEIADLPLLKKGDYVVYVMKKRDWNTVDALRALSKKLGVPFKDVAYGGKKDRHGLTTQFITVRRHGKNYGGVGAQIGLNENLTFSPAGYMDRPMGPDLIMGNRFDITVRDLSDKEVEDAGSEIKSARSLGFTNYFDDQRFGSYAPRQGFIAEKIIKGHYNGALKIYLTHINPGDKGEEKERKRFLFDNWGKWAVCLKKARTEFEDLAFNYLVLDPKGFIPILQKIEREEMSLFFSAFQAYLWNKTVREVLRKFAGDNVKSYKGIVGDYLFYAGQEGEEETYLKGLLIPTPASNAVMPDGLTAGIYAEVLSSEGIKSAMFNNRKIRQAFFKSTERPAVVMPDGVSVKTGEDELYKGRKKLGMTFNLPRGSYATMLVKRLFSKLPAT